MAAKSKSQITRELKQITVKEFISDYAYRIDLDADYQREKIWSKEDQELLLDSIIKNIDIPKLYLARAVGNKNFDYECIDGKQRMTTLLGFFKPENEENPLSVRVAGEKYTYIRLKKELPPLAKKIEEFELTFVIYSAIDDDWFLGEIFRRLQLGIRLNSGESLKAYTGSAIRDFVYKEMGKDAPFLRRTSLPERRFSKEVTLAQICLNSFRRAKTGEFVRARTDDLEEFFEEKYEIEKKDENLARIRKILEAMDECFGEKASVISSRAVAVSAYLFVEGLYIQETETLLPKFVHFYFRLLEEIKDNLALLRKYEKPTNRAILEGFQKHISQASVEPRAIRSRDQFLAKALDYYLDPKTKGRIIGDK
jgi:hypothetical protein